MKAKDETPEPLRSSDADGNIVWEGYPPTDETPGLVEEYVAHARAYLDGWGEVGAEEMASGVLYLADIVESLHRAVDAREREIAAEHVLVEQRDEAIESLHKERDELKRLLGKSVQCHDYLIDCIAAQGGDGSSCPNNEEARSTLQGTGD